MQGDVPAAFELRDPLKRRAKLDAELLLGETSFFAELCDAPADVLAHALGVDGPHERTVPRTSLAINKVIA